MGTIITISIFVVLFLIIVSGFTTVRPMERGLVERFGKYNRLLLPGLRWAIPFVDKVYGVDLSEKMVDAEPQEIITSDKLNARVDAQIYYKIRADEESIAKSQYNVSNFEVQIVNLARTTLRNIIGTMSLETANSDRNKINSELLRVLAVETEKWGVDIVRAELKEISPPQDVQETMNKVVKAANEKLAAVDVATAKETEADGFRRAEIKKAEGIKQSDILIAEGKAQAIVLVNKAAEETFKDKAQLLKKLETVATALKNNTKFVVPTGSDLTNVISDLAGITPIKSK